MTLLLVAAVLPALAAGDSDASGATELAVPGVEYRMNEAAATRSPWIDANGWRILRQPHATYYYDVPADAAALAAAEAFAYSAKALVHTDADGAIAFNTMLEFLRSIPDGDLPSIGDIGVVDDGSDQAGELMNMLARHNLLYRIVTRPDPKLRVNVRIGSKEYPESDAEDPSSLAQRVRGNLGDRNRSLRIYGSEVVVARLLGDGDRARIHLLNYSRRRVLGLRVRVKGEYRHQAVLANLAATPRPTDVVIQNDATEFTLPAMETYTVIDLSR